MISWELAIEPTLYFLFCSYLPLQRQEGAKIQGEMLGVGASRGARSDF